MCQDQMDSVYVHMSVDLELTRGKSLKKRLKKRAWVLKCTRRDLGYFSLKWQIMCTVVTYDNGCKDSCSAFFFFSFFEAGGVFKLLQQTTAIFLATYYFDPLNPNFKMQILLSVLDIFLMILFGRISLTIKTFHL